MKIGSNCVFKNLFWKTEAFLGSGKISKKSSKFNLAIDLMSPWTWVKDNSCKFYNREGGEPKTDDCDVGSYSQTFNRSEKNSVTTKRCAQIAF